jgi:opacity protein-like surface antigen
MKEDSMKKTLLAAVMIATLTLPALASAAGKPGGYFSGFLGFNQTKDATMETTDFLAIPVTTFNDKLEFDPGIYIGGTGGYDFGLLRLEGELSFRNAEINRVNTDRAVDRNLGMLAMMINGWFDLENPSPVTPYWGAGIGLVSLYLDDDYFDRTTGDPVFYEDTASTYAFQAGGGLEISITPRFSLDLGYRFFKTGTATFDKHFDIENKLKVESHNMALGFRAKF